MNWNEIYDLTVAAAAVMVFSPEFIYAQYVESIFYNRELILPFVQLGKNRSLACLSPAYRCSTPLSHGLNNKQILLVLL